ncbi:MAG: hypothetical protein ACTSQE_16575 [Candidatus Heimdallarchaeaceae archaeon]
MKEQIVRRRTIKKSNNGQKKKTGRPVGIIESKPRSTKGKPKWRPQPRKRYPKEMKLDIYQAKLCGFTMNQISRMFGICNETAAKYVTMMRKKMQMALDDDCLVDEVAHVQFRIKNLYMMEQDIVSIIQQQKTIIFNGVSAKRRLAAQHMMKMYLEQLLKNNKEIREESRYKSELLGLIKERGIEVNVYDSGAHELEFAKFLEDVKLCLSKEGFSSLRQTVLALTSGKKDVNHNVIDVEVKEGTTS